MMPRKPLSRRAFLQGSGITIALPFLDAMLPTFARAQTAPTKRFIVAFAGTVVGGPQVSIPSFKGSLTQGALPLSWKSLEAIKQHIAIISNLRIPVYQYTGSGPAAQEAAYIPGGSHSGQHGFTRAPILSGMGSREYMTNSSAGTVKSLNITGSQTCDQHAADHLAGATKFRSLQIKTQAAEYNGSTKYSDRGEISARLQNGVMTTLQPVTSPLALYNMLFSTGTPAPTPSPPPTRSLTSAVNLLARKKSVLDVVLEDATRLKGKLSGSDKQKLELHFEEIRKTEQSLSAAMGNGSPSPSATPSSVPAPGSSMGQCSNAPAQPGADPAVSTYDFGGWANETLRGQIQADLLAYAIGCDLTRVASWVMTHDHCWLNSERINGFKTNYSVPHPTGQSDMHADSHFGTKEAIAGNANWHASLFGRLISNLQSRTDAHGTLLANTFMSLTWAESTGFHGRDNMVFLVAGNPSHVQNGVHMDAAKAHPAQIQIAGLQSLGINMTKMGEVSGALPGLLK